MHIDSSELENTKSWPFVEAYRIYNKIKHQTPKKGYVLFETGYGPSGLPHIGTFAEVLRTTMIRDAFHRICDIPTKLICFSDDMDGMRKIPTNLPNQEMLSKYIDHPLSKIPDPFQEKNSFGEYMNAKLCAFLDRFSFQYELYSSSDLYKSGKFNDMLKKTLEKYDDIMELMLPTLGPERQKTYSPFFPICPDTGKILQVPMESIDLKNHTVTYRNSSDKKTTIKVTDGNCKLQWKPDFGMRWAALEVDYEMYGKEHLPNAEIYSKICRILRNDIPVQFFYELFLDETGAKISKSKGNIISLDDWLKYAPTETIALFLYQSPNKAKKLSFNSIPKAVDEYISFNKSYHKESDIQKKLANPLFSVHNGDVPLVETYGMSFNMLLNLASVCNPDNKAVLWGFITKYNPEANSENSPFLDRLVSFAINYYDDFIKNTKSYLIPNDKQRILLNQIIDLLSDIPSNSSGKEIQNHIYQIGTDANYDNLKLFFQEIYQILLGQSQGPRLGSFIELYGIENSIKLIKARIESK